MTCCYFLLCSPTGTLADHSKCSRTCAEQVSWNQACGRQLKIRSLSVILICRFHLDLQERNAHPNANTAGGLPTISIGSFRVASQRMHDAVIAEFGDSHVGTEGSRPREAVGTLDDISLLEMELRPQGAEIFFEA